MSVWVRARYGDVNNAHGLVRVEGVERRDLPEELGSLTDRPPGTPSRGEVWWPAVGCGPVGDWWACWWCEPDHEARRGGMVKTEVALCRLAEVGEVVDLRPTLCALSGLAELPTPSDEQLVAVWEALLAADTEAVVLPDHALLPGVIAAIWARIWPAARRAFAARAALSPPQGAPRASPWLYGIPEGRRLEWESRRLVTRREPPSPPSRGVRWLLYGDDPLLARLRSAWAPEAGRLKEINQAARIADQIERFQRSDDPADGFAVARALAPIAPSPGVLTHLKDAAMSAILRGLQSGTFDLPRSLRAFPPAPFGAEATLIDALRGWVARFAPSLSPEDAQILLGGPKQPSTLPWWCDATQSALKEHLTLCNPEWTGAALRWLSWEGEVFALEGLLPTDTATEERLMAGLESVALVSHTPLVRRARARRWSCLHAALLKMTRPPSEAIAAQRVFPEDPRPGLRWLIGALPAVEGVRAYVQAPDATLCALAVQRTKAEPASLVGLDPTQAPWRALWSAHVMAGGAPWPPGVDKAALCQSLLQALQTAEEPPGVVPKIAEELAPHVFRSTARSALWARLSAESTRALIPRVVTPLNEALERGEVSSPPEPELFSELLVRWRQRAPSPDVLVRMLQLGTLTDEAQVCQWISRWQTSSLVRHANTLGEQAMLRRWVTLAELLYRRSYGDKQIGQAALLCGDLLSFVQTSLLRLGLGTVGWSAQDDERLIQRVADLGAELAPDRLDSIWEAAGGKTKQLSGQRDRSSAWREAARFAHHGKLDGGLYALSRALLGEFPRNDALRELIDLLAKKHQRDKP